MSVIIKDFDLPLTCQHCPCCYIENETAPSPSKPICSVWGDRIENMYSKRNDNCPLIEISSEGEKWIRAFNLIAPELNKAQEIRVKLEEGESAYSFIETYVRRYWKHNGYTDVIVAMSTSYDGIEYIIANDYVSPNFDKYENGECGLVFENDWWEGERYIKLYGIKAVSEIEITDGIYN